MGWLNPDGEFGDAERARKRGITMGKQEFDGMSRIGGLVTPELRAAIEAMLAKLAAPGMCNPEDATPVVDAAPDEDAVRRDHRSEAQRNHDGFLAGCAVCSLPVSWVSTAIFHLYGSANSRRRKAAAQKRLAR
jgi:Domain of unknown function (DUF222)